jgi:hypothetical protein
MPQKLINIPVGSLSLFACETFETVIGCYQHSEFTFLNKVRVCVQTVLY